MHDPSVLTLAMQVHGLRELFSGWARMASRAGRVRVAGPGLRLPTGYVPAHLDERRPATA